jgi:hypothetical protein
VNSRAFASAYPLENNNYIVCFSRRETLAMQYEIYCQEFQNLRRGTPSPLNSEFLALSLGDANAESHVYIPYLFETPKGFGMIFTARGTRQLETYEWVGLAESSDARNWQVTVPQAFQPRLSWEANQVENFGLLLHDGLLWMNYESVGPSGLQADRAIGIAWSDDWGKSWTRVKNQPSLSGGVYCAGFFVWEKKVYLIASAHNQFRVYRAESPESLSDDSYIGSFFVRNDATVVDTPSVVTDAVDKIVDGNFSLVYSLYEEGDWNTYVTRWDSASHFLSHLEIRPLDPPLG